MKSLICFILVEARIITSEPKLIKSVPPYSQTVLSHEKTRIFSIHIDIPGVEVVQRGVLGEMEILLCFVYWFFRHHISHHNENEKSRNIQKRRKCFFVANGPFFMLCLLLLLNFSYFCFMPKLWVVLLLLFFPINILLIFSLEHRRRMRETLPVSWVYFWTFVNFWFAVSFWKFFMNFC